MTTRIPFEIETSRVIELLAKQIYQSPLALLRENVQNAFDAVRERRQLHPTFAPAIDVTIERERIVIVDNGVGMSPDELRRHFWTAGSSSKNTPEARAAGVVGTFGIGAMANFGIARSLRVETESARTGQRTVSSAEREKLSLKDDCVELREESPQGQPGTTIVAELVTPGSVEPEHAKQYIREFVRLVDVPIRVNGEVVSQVVVDDAVPKIAAVHRADLANVSIGPLLIASGELTVSANAVIRLLLRDLVWNGRELVGYLALRSGDGLLQTARSGFGLAAAGVASIYSFGGVADLQVLEPTAGREAITSDGLQLLQSMIVEIDRFTTERLAGLEQCNSSTPFMHWIHSNGRYDLGGKLTIEASGKPDMALEEARELAGVSSVRVYGGSDPSVMRTFTSEDTTLLVLSRTSPRRLCQEGYLAQRTSIVPIPDRPTVMAAQEGNDLDGVRWGVAFRLESIILDDYFVKVTVAFGEISHGVSILLDGQGRGGDPRVVLRSDASNVVTLLQVYETHVDAFRSLAKDFVRTVVFPHIANLVPSSTRQGAEAFVEAMRRKRETFEYDSEEQDELPFIWEDYKTGKISLESAIDRSKSSVRTNVQYVDVASAVRDVVPDLIDNERTLQQTAAEGANSSRTETGQTFWPAEPPILRTETSSSAKLITIDATEPDLRGYRCYIALAPRAYADFGDFFTQPHSTSVVWGGQKTLFIFIHQSGEFGIYYDMQTAEFVGEHAGGGSQRTSTIVLKDKIYIPIPPVIEGSFVPLVGERKRFEIKADLIRTGRAASIG